MNYLDECMDYEYPQITYTDLFKFKFQRKVKEE